MFERYTERARRVIFFARYEASQFGSTTIETEHLLLGLLREDATTVQRYRPELGAEEIRKRIETDLKDREKVSTSQDLPLSPECKRILAFAAEEAEGINHRSIGPEHILLAVLREKECVAERLLRQFGFELGACRELLKKDPPPASLNAPPESFPPVDRAAVHAFVDTLPEHLLGWAMMLLKAGPRPLGS